MKRPHARAMRCSVAWRLTLAFAFALVVLLPAVAVGQEAIIATGTVTDAATGNPIADASVCAAYRTADGDSWTGEARTAADGTYAISDTTGRGAGEYRIEVAAPGYLPESQTVAWDAVTPLAVDFPLERARITVSIAGADRFTTAIAASRTGFPKGSDYVVIATGLNWPDALGGSALAGALRAPILLTRPNALPSEVTAEIVRLGATHAIVLGGTQAVSAAVFSQIDAIGGVSVERIAGANRYETANKVAARTIAELGAAYDGTAFVATGRNFPDALGASPLAAAKGWPIYLADPNSGDNAGLVATMKAAGVNRAIALGGTNVVAPSIQALLGTSLVNVTRLAGANRYETAVKVAAYGVESAGLSWDRLAIATGQNFPDALAGGVLQAGSGSVLLLTPGTSLNDGVRAALLANTASIFEVRFLGSTSAVSRGVRIAAASAANVVLPTAKIWLDAGHGGADPGAVDGRDDDSLYTEEEDINLGVALKLREALVRCGFEVAMSRTDDTYVPLASRAQSANNWGANAFVALHSNAATGASPRGIESFYQTAADNELASAIDPFLAAVSPWADRGVKYRNNLAVLNGATMPAVLIECGFITNPAEEALLVTASYQRELAEATCKGICAWSSMPYLP